MVINRNVDNLLFTYHGVPGSRCSKCKTEVISRATAVALETLGKDSFTHLMHWARIRHNGMAYTANTPSVSLGSSSEVSDRHPITSPLVTAP